MVRFSFMTQTAIVFLWRSTPMKFIAGLLVWGNGGMGKTSQVFPRFKGSANRRVDLHLPLIVPISGRRHGAWGVDVGGQPRFPGARKWVAPSAPMPCAAMSGRRRITGKQASSTRPVAGSTWLAERRETLGWRLESPGKPDGGDRKGRDAS